jgi:putative acetyltransferase
MQVLCIMESLSRLDDMQFKIDDLSDPRITEFLEAHIKDMKSVSPPESKHALDLRGLRMPDVTFWSAWEDEHLVGCGALKELNSSHAEIKSMRVSSELRGRGIASKLLSYILGEAASKGYRTLSLETGSMPFFEPARNLYEKFGFQYCAPFGNYKDDSNSMFMSLDIAENA